MTHQPDVYLSQVFLRRRGPPSQLQQELRSHPLRALSLSACSSSARLPVCPSSVCLSVCLSVVYLPTSRCFSVSQCVLRSVDLECWQNWIVCFTAETGFGDKFHSLGSVWVLFVFISDLVLAINWLLDWLLENEKSWRGGNHPSKFGLYPFNGAIILISDNERANSTIFFQELSIFSIIDEVDDNALRGVAACSAHCGSGVLKIAVC